MIINVAVTIKQTGLTGINDINNLREIFITILKVEPAQTVNPNTTADETHCTVAHEKHPIHQFTTSLHLQENSQKASTCTQNVKRTLKQSLGGFYGSESIRMKTCTETVVV